MGIAQELWSEQYGEGRQEPRGSESPIREPRNRSDGIASAPRRSCWLSARGSVDMALMHTNKLDDADSVCNQDSGGVAHSWWCIYMLGAREVGLEVALAQHTARRVLS